MTNDDRYLVFDIETDGEPWDGTLVCVGWKYVGPPQGEAFVLTHDAQVTRVPQRGDGGTYDLEWMHLLMLLADPTLVKVTHTKYDARWLRLHGMTVEGPYHDTQVMAWRLNENTPLSLEYVVKRYLHEDMDKRLKRSGGELYFAIDVEPTGSSMPPDGADLAALEATRVVPWATAYAEHFDQVAAYCARDVADTEKLYLKLRERMQDTAWWTHFLEKDVPFTETLLDMECAGLPVNLEASAELQAELEPLVVTLADELHLAAGLPPAFNLNSGPQLAGYLFSKTFELTDRVPLDEWEMGALKSCLAGEHDDCEYGSMQQYGPDEQLTHDGDVVQHVKDLLPPGFTIVHVGREYVEGVWTLKGRALPVGMLTPKGDRPSSSTPALLGNLEVLHDEWVQELTRYRKATKVLTTYLRKFPKLAHWRAPGVTPRLYGRFNQTGTVTGRLSSSEPNLQNLPAHGELGPRVRALFQGDLIVGDYAQLEPRLMAHYSQDPVLLKAYRNDEDIYLTTALGLFGGNLTKESRERDLCKTLILALGYGAGAKKLALILTVNGHPTTVGVAERYLRDLRRLYSGFFMWREDTILRAKRLGYVTTIDGHMRRLSASFKDRVANSRKGRGYGERQAVNAIIQGSAGDIVRVLMQTWKASVNPRVRPLVTTLAQVHDELVFEYLARLLFEGDLDRLLEELAHAGAAAGEHFKLSVPLVFEPHAGRSWLEAKDGTILLPEMLAAGDEDVFEEDE